MLNALAVGGRILYDPKIVVGHPYKHTVPGSRLNWHGYHYGLGFGKVLKKHCYPRWYVLALLAVALGGILKSLRRLDVVRCEYYWSTLVGRLRGFLR